MGRLLPEIVRLLYLTGALGTVGYLASLTSRRLPGWFSAHRPRTVGEWPRAALVALLGVLVAMVIMWVTVIGWPVVLSAASVVEKRRGREKRRLIEEREEQSLLVEIRASRL